MTDGAGIVEASVHAALVSGSDLADLAARIDAALIAREAAARTDERERCIAVHRAYCTWNACRQGAVPCAEHVALLTDVTPDGAGQET